MRQCGEVTRRLANLAHSPRRGMAASARLSAMRMMCTAVLIAIGMSGRGQGRVSACERRGARDRTRILSLSFSRRALPAGDRRTDGAHGLHGRASHCGRKRTDGRPVAREELLRQLVGGARKGGVSSRGTPIAPTHYADFQPFALRSAGGSSMSTTKTPDKTTNVIVEPNPASKPVPITGTPQSHPVGTGVGAASGAGAGALGGAAVAGPVGAAVGAAVGAVVGAVGGHAAAEALDPTVETNYWRLNYKTRPYYKQGKAFGDYEAAYRYGWENAVAKKDMTFEEAEKSH